MSTTSTAPGARRTPSVPKLRLRMGPATILLGLTGFIALLSLVRVLSGVDEITSGGTVAAALRLAVPIGLAALGGLWAERAGVVNIGLEGMMILGTWMGAWAAFSFGPWWGVLAGAIGGALGGLLHALATVTFGVDHIVSGVAINILGAGLTRYLSALIFEGTPGGGVTQSPSLPSVATFTVPGLSDLGRVMQETGWFLVADVGGVLAGLTTNMSLLTLLAILLVPTSYWLLWRTAFGLRLRSCGESPVAAETLGVNVYKMKYIAVVASGAFAGLGGAFLAIVAAGIYREGQTGGRGYIGLAAMIFGNWRPGGLAAGAGLFGYTDALRQRQGGDAVHALLLAIAALLIILAVWRIIRGSRKASLITAGIAALVLVWYFTTDTIPSELVGAAPYVATLLVLALASQRLRMPAADGQPYRKGEAK